MKKINLWVLLFSYLLSIPVFAQDSGQAANAANQEVQEVKYVTDKLRLSLYQSADGNSKTLKLLISGDKLDILEKSGNYSKVKTDEGLIGWVKTGFLVSEPTASFQLIEEKKKNEILVNQLKEYSDTEKLVADYENTISLMKQDENGMSQKLESLQQQLEQSADKTQQLEQQLQEDREGKISIQDILQLVKQYWYALAIAALILILTGFIVGKKLVESQVKRRFQGLKVW